MIQFCSLKYCPEMILDSFKNTFQDSLIPSKGNTDAYYICQFTQVSSTFTKPILMWSTKKYLNRKFWHGNSISARFKKWKMGHWSIYVDVETDHFLAHDADRTRPKLNFQNPRTRSPTLALSSPQIEIGMVGSSLG